MREFIELPESDRMMEWSMCGKNPLDFYGGDTHESPPDASPARFIESLESAPEKWATYMNKVKASRLRGRRVRLSSWARTERVDVWAVIWMRVDNKTSTIAFDNMNNRKVVGDSDWTRLEIVRDVTESAQSVSFGIMMRGGGRMVAGDLRFEEVDPDTPTTDLVGMLDDGEQRERNRYSREMEGLSKLRDAWLARQDVEVCRVIHASDSFSVEQLGGDAHLVQQLMDGRLFVQRNLLHQKPQRKTAGRYLERGRPRPAIQCDGYDGSVALTHHTLRGTARWAKERLHRWRFICQFCMPRTIFESGANTGSRTRLYCDHALQSKDLSV